MMDEAGIARICHEANRAYCRASGDYSHKSWDETPVEIKATTIHGVVFALENPFVTSEEMHNNWKKDKEAQGWKYGPVKDAEKKEHPCIVPYEELPEFDKVKDRLFRAIVSALAQIE